jgi:hypothetical protein
MVSLSSGMSSVPGGVHAAAAGSNVVPSPSAGLTPTAATAAAAAALLAPTPTGAAGAGGGFGPGSLAAAAGFDAKGEMQRLLAKRPHLKQQMKRILDSVELTEQERKLQMRNLVRMLKEEDASNGGGGASSSNGADMGTGGNYTM